MHRPPSASQPLMPSDAPFTLPPLQVGCNGAESLLAFHVFFCGLSSPSSSHSRPSPTMHTSFFLLGLYSVAVSHEPHIQWTEGVCASARLSLILTCLPVRISFFLQAEPAPLPTSKRMSLTPGKPSLSSRQLSRGRMLGGGSQRALDRLRNGLPSLQESLAAANRTGSPGNFSRRTSCRIAI